MKYHERICEEMTILRLLSPEYAERIYAEIKAEANVYGSRTAYERLITAKHLLAKGIPGKDVLEAVKYQKEDILELLLIM